ncbi:MAG: cytosine deaminase, partial [Bacteroidales bacterium]|nr:cytosine deaminase [Bacteroidales bacterium]
MKRFAAEYLYTLDSETPLRRGFVEMDEDGTVLRTGMCGADEPVLAGALAPGFVNAHCHVELS